MFDVYLQGFYFIFYFLAPLHSWLSICALERQWQPAQIIEYNHEDNICLTFLIDRPGIRSWVTCFWGEQSADVAKPPSPVRSILEIKTLLGATRKMQYATNYVTIFKIDYK